MLKKPLMSSKRQKFELPFTWSSGRFKTLQGPFDFQKNALVVMLKKFLMSCRTKKFENPINWSSEPFWNLQSPFDFHKNTLRLMLKRPLILCEKKTLEIPWEDVCKKWRTEEDGGRWRTEEDGGGRKYSHKQPCCRPTVNKGIFQPSGFTCFKRVWVGWSFIFKMKPVFMASGYIKSCLLLCMLNTFSLFIRFMEGYLIKIHSFKIRLVHINLSQATSFCNFSYKLMFATTGNSGVSSVL